VAEHLVLLLFSRPGRVGGDHTAASVELTTTVYWKITKRTKTYAYQRFASLDYCLIVTSLLTVGSVVTR
jgi:hypothetical protein